MPNWCDTTYKVVFEKEEEAKELYSILERLAKSHEPVVKNGFGNLWLGCVLHELGYNTKELDQKGIRHRGEVTDFYLDDNILTICQNTAWCEQEGFRQCIEKKYDCKVYYLDEEPGCDNYSTNDKEGEFFTDKYVVETDDCTEYFTSLTDVVKYIDSEFSIEVPDTTLEEIEEKLQEYENEFWISIHEVQYVND